MSAWKRLLLTLLAQRQDDIILFKILQSIFQDIQGDVASWEKEDEWKTVGKVDAVMLRSFIIITIRNIARIANAVRCHS